MAYELNHVLANSEARFLKLQPGDSTLYHVMVGRDGNIVWVWTGWDGGGYSSLVPIDNLAWYMKSIAKTPEDKLEIINKWDDNHFISYIRGKLRNKHANNWNATVIVLIAAIYLWGDFERHTKMIGGLYHGDHGAVRLAKELIPQWILEVQE